MKLVSKKSVGVIGLLFILLVTALFFHPLKDYFQLVLIPAYQPTLQIQAFETINNEDIFGWETKKIQK